MTITLAPQFLTHALDLEIKKGESAQFAVAVTNFDLDLRGCLVFTEIRRLSPGYNLINGFTGIVTSGSSAIQIKRYPATEDKSRILDLLPVRAGDLITLEGSGINGSKVLAVTDSQIVASNSANRTINEGRLLVRSLSVASFTAVPYSPIISVIMNGTAALGATQIPVTGVSRNLDTGTVLAFGDGGTVKTAIIARDVTANDTIIIVDPLPAAINNAAIAKVGAQTVITTNTASVGATSIAVSPLATAILSGSTLNFATRSADGWVYVGGSCTLSASALAGATSLSVTALGVVIPIGAIAWFGTIPFNSFYLAIDPADTQFLESGDYGYDVICRQANGYTLRIIQGNCKLKDHWSDGV